MWTSDNRGQYDRAKLRYPSDLTDAEWEHIASLIPPAKRGGRKRSVDVLAWLGRCRRLAKDFENLTRNALAFIRLASIRLMARKLCLEA
jgi:transposase